MLTCINVGRSQNRYFVIYSVLLKMHQSQHWRIAGGRGETADRCSSIFLMICGAGYRLGGITRRVILIQRENHRVLYERR